MTLLKVENVTKNFGGLTAISHINLEINRNELIGLIGPNGAGKTNLFNLLTGVYKPSEGSISLKQKEESYELSEKNTSKLGKKELQELFKIFVYLKILLY